MIDVPQVREAELREILRGCSPMLRVPGEDSTFINPLESPPRIHHQSTH
jgi:hypothetical protein